MYGAWQIKNSLFCEGIEKNSVLKGTPGFYERKTVRWTIKEELKDKGYFTDDKLGISKGTVRKTGMGVQNRLAIYQS